MGAPNTRIEILDVPLNNTYEHTFWFKDIAAQESYFSGKIKTTISATTYVRKSWDLQVNFPLETCRTWNYLTFRNGSGKRWYYFITDIEYRNDNCTTLKLQIDVLQSYMFDFTLLDCFIERQHTATDNVGDNTMDEGLEIGQQINAHTYDVERMQDMYIMILSSLELCDSDGDDYTVQHLEQYSPHAIGAMMDNVFSGICVYAVDPSHAQDLAFRLADINEMGKSEAIIGLWMYPKNLVETGTKGSGFILPVKGVDTTNITLTSYDNYKSKLFGGYIPRNNKLYTYPYNYLYVSNNSGNYAEYRYELFNNPGDTMTFCVRGAITPDASTRIYPNYYKGSPENYEEGLSLAGYPSCAWNSDVYKVWLAQNQNQQSLAQTTGFVTLLAGGGAAIASAVSGNAIGAAGGLATAYSGWQQVQGIMAQRKDMQSQPPQAKGNISVTVNVAAKKQTFTAYYKTITKEYAQIIDQYFTKYGYKLNKVGRPNLHARKNYTYIKTQGCTIDGDLCAEDQATICSIFDRGITFWSMPDRLGHYNLGNETL